MAWFGSIIQSDIYSGSAFFSYVLLPVILFVAGFFVFKRQQKVWLINQIPGPKGNFIFGNALELYNIKPTEIFKRAHFDFCDYGSSISKVWLGPMPMCFLYKSSAIEVILSSHKHIDKSSEYELLQPWLKTGLLTSTGKKWQRNRKMLTPTFHFKILENYMDVFNSQSSKLVTKLEQKADGETFDIFQFITMCTLDIILETAMGRKIYAQDNSDSDYVKAIYKMSSIIFLRWFQPWLRPDFLFKFSSLYQEQTKCLKILHGLSYETIRERKREYQKLQEAKHNTGNEVDTNEEIFGEKKKLAFLDLLLEYSEENCTSSPLSDEEIQEEVDTFMFEGHDTTASTINFTLYLLGTYPDIQEKVVEELDSIFGESDRPATMTDLNKMKFLECCIKETMRIYPAVPMFSRELREDVVIDGFKIPSGTSLMLMVYRLHRDPDQFPEPEVFKPERFSPENCVKRNPYAYIPFSAGPRNCIGQKFAQMEDKIVVSTVLRKYRVESTVKREYLKLLGDGVIRPADGNLVKLFPRK